MKLLGIETATESVGAAVSDEGVLLAEAWSSGRRHHVESLAPAVEQVLSESSVSIDTIDVIVVDVGPGLFTGLRVGIAMAKGLAQGLHRGLMAVTSLDALAFGAFATSGATQVLSIVDARRAEVFVARYSPAAAGADPAQHLAASPTVYRPEDLIAELRASGEPTLCVGDGAQRYEEELSAFDGATFGGPELAHPRPATLLALAQLRLNRGAIPSAVNEIEALYLRDADAKINWVQRQPARPAV